jgi:hypothetical protein
MHFCFSRTVTGDAALLHGLFDDFVIHAKSDFISRKLMLLEYCHRNPHSRRAENKKAVNKHYDRLVYLRRKARAEEIISKFKMHQPTFEEVQQYCTERNWRDANTLIHIVNNSWRYGAADVSVRGNQINRATP